jgi:hypothetical protein
MHGLFGFLLSIPFATVAALAGLQLARPDSWYQARIERDNQFIKAHPKLWKATIACALLVLIVVSFIKLLHHSNA